MANLFFLTQSLYLPNIRFTKRVSFNIITLVVKQLNTVLAGGEKMLPIVYKKAFATKSERGPPAN